MNTSVVRMAAALVAVVLPMLSIASFGQTAAQWYEQPTDQYDQHEPAGRVGIGAQVGDPTGLSLKLYRRKTSGGIFESAKAFSFLAAWDLDNFFFLSGHALYERPIPESPLNYYLGPGAVVGIDDRRAADDFVLGISGAFGLNFFTDRFEVFLELMPWIKLIPETDGALGGGIGLRYYP